MQNVNTISNRYLLRFTGRPSVDGETNLSGQYWDATRLSRNNYDGFTKRLWHLSKGGKNTVTEFAKENQTQ